MSFWKNRTQIVLEKLVRDSFLQVVSTLVLIYFGRPRLRHTIKTNLTTLQIFDPEICSIMIFNKRVWD